jgi:ubiquinol-cytochrome c reductase cytochrome b subunit
MWATIKDWIEIRIGLNALIREQLTEYRVPKNINIFYTLGFVALTAFLMQVVTGVFLLIYYVPYSEQAFRSVQDITNKVPYGWLFRQMHIVGSNLMVVVVFLHMLSVFFMGSYKKPREMTWFAGVSMLLLVIASCLSGYLLPWSQLSYWATTIATTIPTAFPYVGEIMAKMMKGGEVVSGVTLNRFFAMHVTLLPLTVLGLVGLHLFFIRRIGISSPPFGPSGSTAETKKTWTEFSHENHPDGYPFFPHFILKETVMVMVYCAAMFFIISFMPTLFLPEDANTPADPLNTPAHIKPEWYLLAAYQMLKLIPNKFLGISIQTVIVSALILWPLLDTGEEENILKRPRLLIGFFIAVIMWVTLTIWGKFS